MLGWWWWSRPLFFRVQLRLMLNNISYILSILLISRMLDILSISDIPCMYLSLSYPNYLRYFKNLGYLDLVRLRNLICLKCLGSLQHPRYLEYLKPLKIVKYLRYLHILNYLRHFIYTYFFYKNMRLGMSKNKNIFKNID